MTCFKDSGLFSKAPVEGEERSVNQSLSQTIWESQNKNHSPSLLPKSTMPMSSQVYLEMSLSPFWIWGSILTKSLVTSLTQGKYEGASFGGNRYSWTSVRIVRQLWPSNTEKLFFFLPLGSRCLIRAGNPSAGDDGYLPSEAYTALTSSRWNSSALEVEKTSGFDTQPYSSCR